MALVNPACTTQTASQTGLWQGHHQWDPFYCLDEVVLDADTNAAYNIRDCLHNGKIRLWTPCREVKALPVERTGTTVGTAPPGLELQGRTNLSLSTENGLPRTKFKEQV